jgi:hypothetical protein
MNDIKPVSEPYIDALDAAYLEEVEDEDLHRTMLCTLQTYRRPDRLSVGDDAPQVRLVRLDTGDDITLPSGSPKPLVLFFGSYT